MSIEHIIEEVPPEGLTVDAIRKVHEAFMFYFNAGGGVMDYEVQCIGALLENIRQLTQQLELGFQMLEANGVPRERARSVHNGIDVLATRCGKQGAAYHELLPCYSIEGLTAFIAKYHPDWELRGRENKAAEPYCTCPADYPQHLGHHPDCNSQKWETPP